MDGHQLVWGFSNNDILEKIHLKFCKILLNLKTSTPSYMVYGELGRYPIKYKKKRYFIILKFPVDVVN
jgi:hypothetical protein